ncbi:hypothetical protein BH09SUM1_BH09SUM1_09800 [soil metagenome]
MVKNSSANSLMEGALEETSEETRVMTDEWGAYNSLESKGRPRASVSRFP